MALRHCSIIGHFICQFGRQGHAGWRSSAYAQASQRTTTTVTIGVERFCLTANRRDDGSLGEVFIHWGKHGTSAAGLVSTYAVALSLGLQHQVPLADLIRP